MLIFELEKIAIEKEVEYTFLPYYYFDSRKDEFYISVNSQILSFSLIYGEIRKNYSVDTSNITKHACFFLAPKTAPFIFDNNRNLFEVYLKSEEAEGENKNYKKKVLIQDIVGYFYDEEMRCIMLVNEDSVHLIRNDFNNNFNTINNIYFKHVGKVISSTFCKKTKYLTLMTANQIFYQLKNFDTNFSRSFKFSFQRGVN